jgi:hypothetical protein
MPHAPRLPILLWGDLVKGASPVLRRALAGSRAHECMYAWVYLTDLLAHRRLLELPSLEKLADLDGALWARADRSAVDPHFQLSRDGFEAVAYMAALAAGAGEARPVFVELGSTFFASKTKLDILNRLSGAAPLQPEWIGIDNSRFMHDATGALHAGESLRLVEDYRSVAKPERFAAFLSRFVASYAFPDGVAFADYLAERFQAAVVEDAYATTPRDEHVFNHGQAETFFSIPATLGALERGGFEIHVLDSYPDYPAGAAPCHVVRYLAARKGTMNERCRAYLLALGFTLPGPAAAGSLLAELNARVTPQRWRKVERAKRESPVWGRTPEAAERPSWRSRLRARLARGLWRRYRLGGPAAVQEIDRALDEEKS